MVTTERLVVGHYELLQLLGEGAFCTVYAARDAATGEKVALKQLNRVNPRSAEAFKREFRTVQGVHHPNLVGLRELLEVDGSWFIAMELVEGDDLITHLRKPHVGLSVDPEALHSAFGQLTEALLALHAAGVVHRDVKPRNVVVTSSGRAVLLDFGLVQALDEARNADARGAGSALYMAPEQAARLPVGPAADFYALGVCLYEVLTGRTPFATNTAFAALDVKQHEPARFAPDDARWAPPALRSLCLELLSIDPQQRPTGASVLRVLGRAGSEPHAVNPARSERFAGRADELAQLDAAFQRCLRGQQSLLLVQGESGIGKSALVAEFTRRALQQRPDTLLLRSHCYENELLAYKAFDSSVEPLLRMLEGLPPDAAAALLPPQPAVLRYLFPAFARLPAIANASAEGLPAEPAALRLCAIEALFGLLSKVAAQRPLVIAIDDLQWADSESFALLQALGQSPRRPPVLIVACVRPDVELTEEAARAVALLRGWPGTSELALTGLPAEAAHQHALQLLGGAVDDSALQLLVRESRGHPLSLAELARYMQTHSTGSSTGVTLQRALQARLAALAPRTRNLVLTVAVAGRPYPVHVLAEAAGLAPSDVNEAASELLALRLLRRRAAHELACYHDRIREVALELLDPAARRSVHAAIAAALLRHDETSDAAELAYHHEAAGQMAGACSAYARAAEQALAALAFTRAEQLASRALALRADGGLSPAAVLQLELVRGHALARAGRSAEAARQYLRAATFASGEEQTQLRIWGAQHLLQSADLEAGMATANALLEELGLPKATSGSAALTRIIWNRACLSMTPRRQPRADRDVSTRERMQLDALWGLSRPLDMLDPLAGVALVTRHMRLAHGAGERGHMTRALAEEAFLLLHTDPHAARVMKLMERARALADGCDDPALDVTVSVREAIVAMIRGQLLRWRERLEYAQRVASERCRDQPWLLTHVRFALGQSLCSGLEHARLARESERWLNEAHGRNDRVAIALLEGLGAGHLRHLMSAQAQRASDALSTAFAPWPREPFCLMHLGEMQAHVQIELYSGGEGALRWFEREHERLGRAFLLSTPYGKVLRGHWEARACLCAHAHGVEGSLERARALSAGISRLKLDAATLHHAALHAQLLALDGDRAGALAQARAARTLSERDGDAFLTCGLQYLEGWLDGDEAGAAKREAALGRFAAEGWRAPRRAVAIQCPAIDALEGQR